MSIKSELISLRKENENLKLLMERYACRLTAEEAKQKEISEVVEEFAKRKSELAKKLYKENKEKLKVQTQKINQIRSTHEQYQEKYFANIEKINFYLENTSFYINEQVSYLIEAFFKYVQENEFDLARNITSKFEIVACIDKREYGYIPNGNFLIKKVTGNTKVIAETKDYYFKKGIGCIYCDDEYGYTKVHLHEWYIKYDKDFRDAFIDTLEKQFKSENFKLTIDGYSFTLDLI